MREQARNEAGNEGGSVTVALPKARRVTLAGIKRRGLSEWKGREDWVSRKVRICSREHCAYWRPDAKGYTGDPAQAWVVEFPEAYQRTAHCGPEKRIVFYAAQ